MTDKPSAKLDPRTLEIIEDEFSERLFIDHVTASALLQVDRKELTRMGDVGRIGYQLKGARQRRYTRTHIFSFVGNDKCESGKIEKADPSTSSLNTGGKNTTARAKLLTRIERAKSKRTRGG